MSGPTGDERLEAALAELAARGPGVGTYWQHRSGGVDRVDRCAVNEADLAPVVVYTCLQTKVVWVRPLSQFRDGRFAPLDESPEDAG